MNFKNLETRMMGKWYGKQIEELILSNKKASEDDLVCLVSERLENLVKEDLSLLTEGYVSEVIGESFDNVDYHELISYFKENEPSI